MGGNGVFNVVLSLGLSLYIDDGKPVGDQFSKTVRNLRDISPISYTNAPAGFASLAAALEGEACGNAGSRRIGRVLLLSEPASIDHNEITDKGYINQRAGLTRRSAAVERLYADSVTSDVIIIPR